MSKVQRESNAGDHKADSYRPSPLPTIGGESRIVRLLPTSEAENKATRIRLRAERRCGELLKEMKQNGTRDQGKGGDRKSPSDRPTVKLEDLGISRQQSSDWQKMAEDFHAVCGAGILPVCLRDGAGVRLDGQLDSRFPRNDQPKIDRPKMKSTKLPNIHHA